MATKVKPRITRKIEEFDDYISTTDDRQLDTDPATTQPYYKTYGWTAAESAAWTAFRAKSNSLISKYTNKKVERTTKVTEDLNLNIEACIKYDNDPTTGHGLLDMVARRGSIDDWLTFNVRRGTPLQDDVRSPGADVVGKEPQIVLSETGHLFHKLTFINPDAPTSKAKPKGVKDIQVFVAVVAADAGEPPASAYQYHDDFRRGHAIINHDGGKIKMVAWYIARYESTNGQKGDFCDPVSGTII